MILLVSILGSSLLLGWCTSQPPQQQIPIEQTSLGISIPQQAQPIPNLLVPTFTGISILKAYKIAPDQTCSIQKLSFKNGNWKIATAYIKTLEDFFPGFSLEDLSSKQLQCWEQTYNTYLATFVIPHADQNYYFYQSIIPLNNSYEAIVISCESKQPTADLAKIVYNIKCFKNE